MNKFFKRLALLLAVLMIVSMMPVQLFADNSVTGEGQSNGTTQNKAVASYELNGVTISFEGKTIREVNTEMRKYWEVDDANGCSYNADRLPADGTGALTWTIYGTVGQGEYLNSGALILPALSGGYIYKDGTYQWKNITVVAGDENATIVSNDTFDVKHIYVSNGANATTTFTGITLDGSLYVVPNGTVTFDGCVFKGMLRVPSGNGVVKVANCRFDGDKDENSTGEKNEYPFFFQAGGTLEFIGNNIAAHTYKRGLNVGGLTGLNATIENNTIGAVTAGYSAIQLSGGVTEAKIKGNKISLDGTNAFTLHGSLISANKVTKVTVDGNTITGNGYLIYDDAAANNKAFTSENLKLTIGTNTVASTVDTKQGVKESNKYDLSTVVKDALTPTYVAKVNGVDYASLAEAIAKATPDDNGVITYEISGKAEISGADQWISFVKNAEGVIAVKFVGMTEDAEISITSSGSILGVQGVDVDVSFENLTLSHPNGAWVDDLANATNYFACMVRRDGHTVTYTKCTFPNGACNNQFGKTVFNDCKFTSTTGWSLWNTSTGTSELNNCSFTGKRGIKLYAEGLTSAAGSVTVKDTTFVLNDSEKAAIEITKPGSVALDNISVSGTTAGTIKKNLTDGYKSVEKVTVTATGTGISGTFNGTTESGVAKEEFNISAGTFTSEVSSDYLADGFELKDNGNGTYGVKTVSVAKIGTVEYATLDVAIAAAKDGEVIVVSAGEYKLNGSLTYTGKAFTIKAADGAKVSFDMSAAVALSGAKITFEGVTFDYKTNGNYIGIQHADTLEYNSCTINGQVFLYATNETFNGCTFNQRSAGAYNVWTYGAKNVEFNKCVFNCVGKSVLLYNEGANTGTDLTVTDTTFKASASVAGKAAIEIDTSLMRGQSKITVDKATADKTKGFANGSNSGNTLWNDKANEKASDNENVTVVVADETVYEPAIIDLDTFIKKLVASGYNFDGKLKNGGKLTVKWSPVSGCYDARTGHACTVNNAKATGNTPKRVNSGLTQFQLFEGSNVAVTIKNVKFVYEPAAFTVCENSGWKGSFTAADAPAGQLYFMTTGDVTVESCDFEKVVFTTFNTTGTSIVNGCTFKYVYNSYAIKDIRGENVSVTGTTIENCGGGIMVSSTGTVSNVTITGNKFNNVDTAGTAAADKVGTRAILQIASSGKYENTAFDFRDNTATSCGPVIRQLNKSVAPVGSSLKYLTEGTNTASGLYTSDSNVTYVAEVTFTDGTTKKYSDIAEALEAANAGDTVKLLADVTADVVINKNITLDLGGKTLTNTNLGNATISVTGGTVTVKNGTVIGGTSYYNIEVTKGSNANLTLEDVTATAGNTGSSMIDNWGTMTIKSGTYTGGMNTVKSEEGSTLVINDGTFTCDYGKKWSYTATILVYGNTTINGGTFIQKTTNTSSYAKVVMTGIVEGYEAITKVTGGTFTNEKLSGIFWALGNATSDNFEVSGGTFNKSISDSYCAEGFIPTKNADGTYGVKEGMYVAKVGSKKYETLADAIRLAAKGKTITLLADVTEDVVITAKKNITLDLGGKTLNGGTGNTKATITNYGTITIIDSSAEKTGTIKRDDNGTEGETSFYVIRNFGTMTIEQANIINNSGYKKTNPSGSMVGSSLICNGDDDAYSAVLNIKGGTIRQDNFIAIKNGSSATLNVTGGKITSNHSAVQNWCNANITGGELNGQLWTDSWDSNSTGNTVMGGDAKFTGEIVIDITGSIVPKFEITGGTLDVTNWKITTAAANAGAKPAVSGGKFTSAVPEEYCAEGFIPTKNADGTYGVKKAMKGSEKNPYTLKELGEMTRDQYIAAQEALGGTMYVEIGNYSYDKEGVLGNGVRNDTPGQTEDRSVLNGYNSNGYLGKNNDGANGKNIIFVGGSITSGVTGYASIDNIGTSLLLAVPAYTNVTFEGTTFNNVMSFDYQLYTGPWSQLGKLKFDNCKFNGLIVGAIAAQTLTFNGCEFENYTNTTKENNSNPTWIRPAYGNWTQGDNEGQGSDFRSLTTINFTGNKVTSTRPVKFEYISQWDITSTVTATGNYFDITKQSGDTSIKNVGLYLGAHTDANEFHLVAADNTKSENTAALYTIPSGKTSLPVDSTVKNTAGESIELTDALKWKATDAEKDKIVLKTVIAVASIGERRFATLEEAFAAAKNGDTITLLSDVELSSTIVIKDVMNVTLDLNGKKLSTTTKTGDATRHYYAIDNYGTFTLRDSSAEQSGEIRARGIENLGTGTMTIESGKIVAIDANGGAAIWNNANLTINGGTFVAEHVGTSSDQYGPGCVYNNGTLTINGGTFTSANKRTYAIVSKAGTVTITPADGKNVTISGAHGGLGIDGGTAIINGGSYASSDYYGLYVSNDAGTADVTVNGGTFTGKKYSVLIGSDGSSSVTSTLKIKGGTFDMPIHAQENTIDGTIAISGGKFKVKVDDKYFDGDHACSTDKTDGYYTVAGHPIISAGLTISADMSFRVKVRSGYENGSLRYYYDTIGENNTIVRVEGEGILGATDADGNSIFRIYNVNPQRADLVYTFQYYDAEGNAVGTPKQRSVIAYFEDFYYLPLGDNEDLDAKKTFIANFLEYCASAMERSYDLHKDVTLNDKTWQDRADAVREMMTRLGLAAADYEFKGNLGRYYSDNVNGVIIERGVAFGSTFKVYYAFSKATIDNGYRVFRQGMDVTDKLELVDGAYRLYFELAPYEFKDNLTITVNNGTTKVCEYTSPLANTLEVLSKSADASVSKMAKAAFNYFVALQNYNG